MYCCHKNVHCKNWRRAPSKIYQHWFGKEFSYQCVWWGRMKNDLEQLVHSNSGDNHWYCDLSLYQHDTRSWWCQSTKLVPESSSLFQYISAQHLSLISSEMNSLCWKWDFHLLQRLQTMQQCFQEKLFALK